ncbi:MAG: hypothetical protein WB696_21945 [Chthoniobacterales bacterium]
MRNKAAKKIRRPKEPKTTPPVNFPKFPSAEIVDGLIAAFIEKYPIDRQDEIARLVEDRARHWRLENEVAQLGPD